MKITQVVCQILRIKNVVAKTASSQDAVLVRIRTDTGLEGIGEADSSPEVVKAIVDAPFSHNIACGLRELLVGENPLETERLWQKMYRRTMYFGRTSVTITAMAAVDMALWDLKGKHFGEPIHRLLGGKQHDRIKAYASILFGRDGRETADIGRRWVEAGYRAVKFGWEPMGQSEALDIELVRGAREGIGDATLLIDAGCVWDARTALRRAQAFADYKAEWLEEPLRSDDVEGYVWLRDRSPVPIAAGEEECGREAFRPLIDRRALDVYQVDLAAQRLHRRGVHPRPRRGDRRTAVQSLLHQSRDGRRQPALAEHLPRRVLVRGLRRGFAAAARTDARKSAGRRRLDRRARPAGPGRDARRGFRPIAPGRRIGLIRA